MSFEIQSLGPVLARTCRVRRSSMSRRRPEETTSNSTPFFGTDPFTSLYSARTIDGPSFDELAGEPFQFAAINPPMCPAPSAKPLRKPTATAYSVIRPAEHIEHMLQEIGFEWNFEQPPLFLVVAPRL